MRLKFHKNNSAAQFVQTVGLDEFLILWPKNERLFRPLQTPHRYVKKKNREQRNVQMNVLGSVPTIVITLSVYTSRAQ